MEDRQNDTAYNRFYLFINFAVLLLCLLSFTLCVRSLWRAASLRARTNRFFTIAYKKQLDLDSSLHFLDGWILMILFNDALLVFATGTNLIFQFYLSKLSSLHVSLVNSDFGDDEESDGRFLKPSSYNQIGSALLGVGNLLVWFGLLRYLAFFSKYNLLIVTLKHSFSRVFRFLVCVFVLYSGFCFSGWIILGPYHYKFETLARTSECLYALMNGDDVFATFAYLKHGSWFVWWFSRAYLYSFVLLFIYVILSLFIAILMDSYETIKGYYSSCASSTSERMKRRFFANDPLSRFMIASGDEQEGIDEAHRSLDMISSMRISLLHDEEAELLLNSSSGQQAVGESSAANDCLQAPCNAIRSCFRLITQRKDPRRRNGQSPLVPPGTTGIN